MAATWCMSLPPSIHEVTGLPSLHPADAALVSLLWKSHHGNLPSWLQQRIGDMATAPGAGQLAPCLPEVCCNPRFTHILRLLDHAIDLAGLRAPDGSTALHLALVGVEVPALGATADAKAQLTGVCDKLNLLLYAGVPLHATNAKGLTASKQARLAIQHHRADNADSAARNARYLDGVERIVGVLEKLETAGSSLHLSTQRHHGRAMTVVIHAHTRVHKPLAACCVHTVQSGCERADHNTRCLMLMARCVECLEPMTTSRPLAAVPRRPSCFDPKAA